MPHIPYAAPELRIVVIQSETGYAISSMTLSQPASLTDNNSEYTPQGNESSSYEHVNWEW